jgi:hypothetical protein
LLDQVGGPVASFTADGAFDRDDVYAVRRSRLFGQLPGKNKLKAWSRLLISPFPEIKIIPCCCGVL